MNRDQFVKRIAEAVYRGRRKQRCAPPDVFDCLAYAEDVARKLPGLFVSDEPT